MQRLLLRWPAAFALLMAALLATGMGMTAAYADAPLPAAQAFKPRVERSGPHMLVVSWRIASGAYLYRHALAFHLADGGEAHLGTPQIPPGHKHRDPYFGSVETYRHRLQVSLPIIGQPPPQSHLKITYRGCADAGLCYPPQHDTLALPPESDAAAAQSRPQATHNATPASDSGDRSSHLAARLGQADLWYTMALFFVLGIGLAFTPCILPMIPIVAGMLGTRDHSRRRAATLTGAYVVAMALAYGVFGLIAGYFGTNLQALLQRPAVLLPFAALFAILAAASFGWFELQLPRGLRARVASVSPGGRGIAGAAILGFLAALIAGPCLAPPLAGALLYISSSGDVLSGALALFALGLGIGAPLIALAVFGVGVLPRSGPWMVEIRVVFGVLLAAIGLWLALRLAPPEIALAAWGTLALAYGAYLSTRATISVVTTVLKRMTVALLFGYAALAGAGLSIGGGRPTAPLATLAAGDDAPAAAARTSPFKRVTTAAQLSRALTAARQAGRPAVVDVYADWCVDCVRMQHTVFADPAVRRALSRVAAIQFDVTAYDPGQRQMMQDLNVFGPPTLLFYRSSTSAIAPDRRLVGTIDAGALVDTLAKIHDDQHS